MAFGKNHSGGDYMQIVQYKNDGNTISCGFVENGYVVYAQIGVKDNWTQADYLQAMYEEVKPALDYERNRFLNGESNSITTQEEGEEWFPEPSRITKIEFLTSITNYTFTETELEKNIDLSIAALDQYNEVVPELPVLTTNYGEVIGDTLVVPQVETPTTVTVVATLGELSESIAIQLHPSVAPATEIEILQQQVANQESRITEQQMLINAMLGVNE